MSEFLFRQAEGRDCHPRPPEHPQAGGDLPEHGGRLPLRARPQAQTHPLQSRRLHLQKR